MKRGILLIIVLTFTTSNSAYAIIATPATGATSNLSHKVALGAVSAGGTLAVTKKGWFASNSKF